MKLSTKGRYGTRALLELALHYGEGPIQLKDIARRQQIPLRYLENLITPLVNGGLVRSIRGVGGGVLLARPLEEIKLSEVVKLLEGPTTPVECVYNPEICGRSETCVTRDVWSELDKAINGVLEATTLENLVDRYKQKEKHQPTTYHI
jgi:Rrf2 family protein